MLTAALAVLCALWPAARRFIRPVVALAAVNVMATPFTSGEWFYQRAEDASYEQAVAKGDFAAFERLLDQHDPHLLPRMVALAVGLLVPLVGLAVLQVRSNRGEPASAATTALVSGAVVLAALVSVVQGFALLV